MIFTTVIQQTYALFKIPMTIMGFTFCFFDVWIWTMIVGVLIMFVYYMFF